jgi:hypothetical protein
MISANPRPHPHPDVHRLERLRCAQELERVGRDAEHEMRVE